MSEEKPYEPPRCESAIPSEEQDPEDVEYERRFIPRASTAETVAENTRGQTGGSIASMTGDNVQIWRAKRKYGTPGNELTPAVHDLIIGSVRRGNFVETAAKAAGVQPHVVRQWLLKGAQGEEPYVQFHHDFQVADGRCEDEDQSDIRKAGSEDWKAKAWRLERRHPDRWGLRMKLEVQHQLERFLDRCKDSFDQSTYEKLLSIAAEVSGGDIAISDLSSDTG